MTPERSEKLRVSVVTVVKDAVGTIEDTLRSVASQTYPEVEHIVVDGGSVAVMALTCRRFICAQIHE